jgi:regulator of replication initiation timing
VARDINYDFSGVDKPKNENDFYSLRYAEFVVPLVKAVQELAAENSKLRAFNEKLNARLSKVEAELNLEKDLKKNQPITLSSAGQY